MKKLNLNNNLNSEQKVFVYTNPLYWCYLFILFLLASLLWIWENSGLQDWRFALFKLPHQSDKTKEIIITTHGKRTNKLFWIKQKAWDYAVKKIHDEK